MGEIAFKILSSTLKQTLAEARKTTFVQGLRKKRSISFFFFFFLLMAE